MEASNGSRHLISQSNAFSANKLSTVLKKSELKPYTAEKKAELRIIETQNQKFE